MGSLLPNLRIRTSFNCDDFGSPLTKTHTFTISLSSIYNRSPPISHNNALNAGFFCRFFHVGHTTWLKLAVFYNITIILTKLFHCYFLFRNKKLNIMSSYQLRFPIEECNYFNEAFIPSWFNLYHSTVIIYIYSNLNSKYENKLKWSTIKRLLILIIPHNKKVFFSQKTKKKVVIF